MIARIGPQERAALIYAQARSELSGQLWKAALGEDRQAGPEQAGGADKGDVGLDTLIALLGHDGMPRAPVTVPHLPQLAELPDRHDTDGHGGGTASAGGLGVNAGYLGTLNAAAERTGIPAPALAAIVHAEAATGADGRWLTYSRNPRSSAAGLGQFLTATWIGEAERPGTWLHAVASDRGWLNGHGRVTGDGRSPLLALRYDGDAAIQAIADYASANLGELRAAGVAVDGSAAGIARTAYVGHHLGRGDAIRFLKGELDPGHARKLLKTQIGSTAAEERIAAAGDGGAVRAHRDWLLGYMARNIRPDRFGNSFAAAPAGAPPRA